jgi:hypothetical protein
LLNRDFVHVVVSIFLSVVGAAHGFAHANRAKKSWQLSSLRRVILHTAQTPMSVLPASRNHAQHDWQRRSGEGDVVLAVMAIGAAEIRNGRQFGTGRA